MYVMQNPADVVEDELIVAYLDKLRRTGASHLTVRNHLSTGRSFQSYLRELGERADTVEPHQVQEYFDSIQERLAPITLSSQLRRMRAWYNYALRRGVIERDPSQLVELPAVRLGEPVTIEPAKLREYKRAIPNEEAWAQFHLLAFTGLRRRECIELQWEHLDFKTQTLSVVRGKGGKSRRVPIHPQLAEALQEIRTPKEGPVIRPKRAARWIGPETWSDLLSSYTQGENTAHDFRRTVASSLATNGVADPLIDKIMGWASAGVGRRYYIKVAEPELRRAILHLYADDPI